MIEKPIMFSAPMVLAVLEGRKTQTRRLAKARSSTSLLRGQPDDPQEKRWGSFGRPWTDAYILDPGNQDWLMADAAHRPEETMWVREAWKPHSTFDGLKPRDMPESKVFYRADNTYAPSNTRWYPSIHMPRWASRIDLRCTGASVERLHDITEADAMAEGIWEENVIVGSNANGGRHCEETADRYFYRGCQDEGFESAVDAYTHLWVHLHGQASWDANPLVWVYEFSVERAPT